VLLTRRTQPTQSGKETTLQQIRRVESQVLSKIATIRCERGPLSPGWRANRGALRSESDKRKKVLRNKDAFLHCGIFLSEGDGINSTADTELVRFHLPRTVDQLRSDTKRKKEKTTILQANNFFPLSMVNCRVYFLDRKHCVRWRVMQSHSPPRLLVTCSALGGAPPPSISPTGTVDCDWIGREGMQSDRW
jgi:hypothetical protein